MKKIFLFHMVSKPNLRIKMLDKLLRVFLITGLLVTASYATINKNDILQNNRLEQENKKMEGFKSVKEHQEYLERLDKSIKELDNIGMMWAIKGLAHLFDYRYPDGEVEADLKQAEYCFAKAIENQYKEAIYLYALALHKQKEDKKALNAMGVFLSELSKDKDLTPDLSRLYIQLSNLYGGILVDGSFETADYQNGVTYIFKAADKYKNPVAQLEIGILYRKIKKKEQSDYFIIKACSNPVQHPFVVNFCKNNLEIVSKGKGECKECEMKKLLKLQ